MLSQTDGNATPSFISFDSSTMLMSVETDDTSEVGNKYSLRLTGSISTLASDTTDFELSIEP